MARRAGISDFTARKHRENLFRKAGVGSVCGLLARAWEEGWLEEVGP